LVPNLTERTNGQLQLRVSSFPELGLAGTDTMSLVRDGTLSGSEIYGGYIGGEYPAFDAMYLWGLWTSSETHYKAQTAIFDDLETIIEDATGAVVWSHNWIPNDQMIFSSEVLRTLDDFKGLKTRSHSASLSDWLEGMGAEPQYVAFAEVYDALERGSLDAGVTGGWSAHGQRWYEVTRYMNGGLTNSDSTMNVINKQIWDGIPADLQQILIEEGAKLELEALRIAGIQNLVWVSRNVNAGLEHVQFSDAIKNHSFDVAALQHVVPGWVKRVGGPNHPAVTEMFNKKIGPIVGVEVVPNNSSQGFIVQKTR